jgi:phospholipase/carboxylesterase
VVEDIEKAGIPSGEIYLLGFSQGACLALEFATRNARQWGGVIAFTGGLIGDKLLHIVVYLSANISYFTINYRSSFPKR